MKTSFDEASAKYPNEVISLERRDNDMDYGKNNCCWIPWKEQSKNRRTNYSIEYGGKTMNLADWSRELGVKYGALLRRLRRGWSIEDCIGIPVGSIQNGYSRHFIKA
jgi:hypothetical protein